ncbi:glycosyltransferase [Curtobacterium sp. C1]|uniref:glycosyltransferase n=1 Tax=Curtobacterium sp. C1 TaxID=2898151 RepID=UPI001E4F335D|nr:glycosyltransferase [Curtobacterium sp. C1]UFU14567.1 glycosyltransferase [Curtobacterium sp. C1]
MSEGGAGGVARTLFDGLGREGFEASIAYGYGPSGGSSPLEAEYDAIRLTSRLSAAANLAAHRIHGEELPGPLGGRLSVLKAAIERVDLVHLHAVHSYMLPPTGLMKVLESAAKPVVWTMHDQWLMTGRCAQPGACEGWRTGCDPCPHPEAYPSATLDRAAVQFARRRDAFAALSQATPVKLVACARWLAEEMREAGFTGVSVITNSVDPEFWRASQSGTPRTAPNAPTYLFMSRDLRDRAKVDLELLREISEAAPGRVTIVGDNAPERIQGAKHLPAVADRGTMVRLMKEHSHLLFFSRVDYYPLTIAEALTAGMHIVANPSKAASEFASDDRVIIVSARDWRSTIAAVESRKIQRTLPNALFDPQRMVSEYADVYREALS